MDSRRKNQEGITLLEILVVIGLLAILASLGLFISMDSYRDYAFHNERDMIITLMQKARSQSLNNVCVLGTTPPCTDGKAHGIHLQTGQYTIFQVSSANPVYAQRDQAVDETLQANTATVTVIPSPFDIVFTQLSATATPASVTVSDTAGHSSVISVNSEGRISWTN